MAVLVGAEIGSHFAFRLSLFSRALDFFDWLTESDSIFEERSYWALFMIGLWRTIKTTALGGILGAVIMMGILSMLRKTFPHSLMYLDH